MLFRAPCTREYYNIFEILRNVRPIPGNQAEKIISLPRFMRRLLFAKFWFFGRSNWRNDGEIVNEKQRGEPLEPSRLSTRLHNLIVDS